MAKIKKNEETFFEFSKQDMFNDLKEIKNAISELKIQHLNSCNEIIQRQDKTNGKVKLNRWVATTSLSLVIMLILYLLNHIIW